MSYEEYSACQLIEAADRLRDYLLAVDEYFIETDEGQRMSVSDLLMDIEGLLYHLNSQLDT